MMVRMMAGRIALLAVLLPAAAFAAPLPPLAIAVEPGTQPHTTIRIKDADLDVRLALSFDYALVLNAGPAARAGLKPFPLIGKRTFKNSMLPGGEATFRGNLYKIMPRGLEKSTVPAIWVDKPIAVDADGILSISPLKSDRITLVFGPVAPGSKTYTLTRKGGDSVMMQARVGDEKIDVALELNSPDTVMNARAAAALINAGVMKRAGEVGFWRPFPGIELPFERLAPMPNAQLFGLPLGRAGVRITEAEAKAIDARAKAGTSTAGDDEDAITVTASRKKGRDPWILIGRDMLCHCSRIEFDRPAKAWHLTCAF
jgi:hypothetical protein